MAKDNAVAENNTNEEVKEMNNNVQQEAPVQEQQATPAQQPVAQNAQVPAEVPATQPTEEKVGFWQKAKAGAKKWGKRIAIAGAVVGGILVAHKLGEASGFDKATDAYNNRQSGNDPEPDESSDNDLGEADFNEVSDSEE